MNKRDNLEVWVRENQTIKGVCCCKALMVTVAWGDNVTYGAMIQQILHA